MLVSLIGFWEWRSALLMALSIPITLAMTFGMMYVLGIDLQQISIASLIIALGLLVDDPVVAGDAIKRELAAGPSARSSRRGSGRRSWRTAILFATITNIVAYCRSSLLPGDAGQFIYSLPVVLALLAGGVAHRVDDVHPAARLLPAAAEGRADARGAAARRALRRCTTASAASRFVTGGRSWRSLGGAARARRARSASQLKTQFFPKDLSYLSYVDVWLPEDAPLAATDRVARQVEATMRRVADEYGKAALARIRQAARGAASR